MSGIRAALFSGLRFAIIAAAAIAAIYLLVLVRAEQLFSRDTPVSVPAALSLQPENSVYLDRLASWQADERQSLLRRSVAANPFNYSALIRLGLLAEMQDGDNAQAERYYRQAAEVNHMFLPMWTLTNFYFRQQEVKEFFHWSKKTLAITPYASDPVFAQMWLMSQDGNVLNAALPDRPRILLQYAWFLSNTQRFNSIPDAVERLVRAVGSDDPDKWGRNDLLAVSEDHMLAAGYLRPAMKVWSTLNEAGWLKEAVPDAQRPLTNGDFSEPFFRHGFDWVPVDNSGTRVEQFPENPGVRIRLFGDEAEKVTLLQQYVAVAPGKSYVMRWQAQADELSEPSGLAWHLHPIKSGNVDEVESGDVMSSAGRWVFTAPAGAKLFLLTLEYARPLGNTRARGSVVLKAISIDQK